MRHAQSVGNEADARARESGAEVLDLEVRDADVELSATGEDQAKALAEWLADLREDRLPTVALSSPYRRAAETARTALAAVGREPGFDERLRERDLGAFDGLTGAGIRARYAEEATRRQRVGKFYYQPPCGESWADVVLRVRSLLTDLQALEGERVWLFTHQAVIMCFRYVLEGLDEAAVLDLDRRIQIPNVSVSTFVRDGERFHCERFAATEHLEDADADVTRERSQGGRGDEQH
ncbi:MAG: histidine phosphatase family protein [Marmoricola sp.]